MQLKLFLTSAATAALLANVALAQTAADPNATDPRTGAEMPADPAVAAIEPRFTSKAGMLVGDVIGMVFYYREGLVGEQVEEN